MKPRAASGVIGGTTTICAQQQRHPSPEPPSLVSGVLWLEKMQESGEMSSQAKISVAASSSTRSVTTRRIVGHFAMKSYSIAIGRSRRRTLGSKAYLASSIILVMASSTSCATRARLGESERAFNIVVGFIMPILVLPPSE